jgi:hypothetical protein
MPTILVNQTLSGSITSTDPATNQENWSVSLAGATTYTIRAFGYGNGGYTLGDPYIEGVFRGTSTGTFVGFNNDGLISGPYGRDSMFTFTTPSGTATTYTITVTGDRFTTGTYGVSVTNSSGGTDSVLASTATTATVAVGGSVTGTIDSTTDSDWYRVALVGGTTYSIRVRGLTSGGGTLPDPAITGLYDGSGNYIGNTYVDDTDTRDAAIKFVAPSTGNYYIAADGWSTYTGTFTLDVAATGNDVTSNTSTSATIAVGGSATVQIEQPYDHDWYAVTLAAGNTYQFTLSGTNYNNMPGIHGIVNSAGTYVVSYASPVLGPASASASTIFTPTQSGTYYIDTYSLYEGTYTLTAAQIAGDVPASTASNYTVAVGGYVDGDIGGATDTDWYKVTLVANTTYAIKMQGRQSDNGTLEDPIISGIYNASGVLISGTFSDDNDGNEASLMFRPTSSGTYYIAAEGYAGYTGTYRLSVTEMPGDVVQSITGAPIINPNDNVLVTIEDTADNDWYGIDLVAGTNYVVRLQGSATKRGTLYDPVLLGIYDSTGALLPDTFVDDVGELRNAKLAFTPTTSGRYYVATDGYDRFTGTMKLSVTTDYIGTTIPTAKIFTAGTSEEGTIDTVGDVDRYGVSLEASTVYYFKMRGYFSRYGDLADPTISGVYNSGGTLLSTTALTDPKAVGPDAWVKLTTTTAGMYYLDTGGNGTEGTFMLDVDKEVPATNATQAVIDPIPGTYFGFIEDAGDVDWVKVTLNTNVSYLIKMRGFDSDNGTLTDPNITGVRLGTNLGAVIAGTSVNDVDTRDSLVRIIPSTAGVHYIAAQANPATNTTGSYLLSVETEPGNTALSSWTLPVPGEINGTIDDTTDVDWYGVTLTANLSYVVKMMGVDSALGTLDNPYINGIRAATDTVTIIAGTNGTAVDSAVLRDSVARIIPTATGVYYITAQSGTSTMGTYYLSVAAEPGNTVASSWALPIGKTVDGSIDDNADIDYYKVLLDSTKSYIFKMIVSDGTSTLSDAVIASIRNSANAIQAGVTINTAGTDAYARWVPASTADYYIVTTGLGTNNGTFELDAEVEPGNTIVTSGAIELGETLDGAIEDNTDVDYYRVGLTSGYSYVFKMLVTNGRGTLTDTVVGLRNSSDVAQTATASISTTADYSYRWVATASTDFFIEAKGLGTNNGTYKVFADIEAGSATTNALTMAVGDTVDAEIDDLTDTDYYRINLSNTSGYLFKMLVTNGVGTLSDTVLELRNGSNGLETALANTATTADSFYRWTPTTSGDYYIVAKGLGTNSGTYELVAEAEPGQSVISAGSMAVGDTVDSAINDNADIDYYRINLSNTSGYLFKMVVTNGVGTLSDTVLELRNGSNGLETALANIATTADSFYRWTPTTSGDYYIVAKGTTANNGTYRLSAETEPGQSVISAGSIAVGQTIDSAIDDTTDIDYYRVNLSNTSSYLFKMIVTGGVGTLTDTLVQLRNGSNGLETAAGSASSTADFTYRWAPSATGDYYIEAKPNGAISGTYRLTVETEAGTTATSAAAITFGDTVTGSIDDTADVDYYRVNLLANQSYVFRMVVTGGAGTLSDATIGSIRDLTNVVQSGMGSFSPGTDFVARWSPTTTGDYLIETKGTGSNSGTFRLSVELDTPGNIASAGTMALDTPLMDTIDDPADTDFYRIALDPGYSYVVRMIVTGGVGTLNDSSMSVRDSSNGFVTALGTNSATADYSFRWAPTVGDYYYVEAKGTGANAGSYQLLATTETGTNTTNYRTMAVGDTVTDNIDDTTDTDYFRIALGSNKSYVMKMIVSGGAGTLADTDISLRDLSNNIVTPTGTLSSTTDFSLRWIGTAADYFIEAKGTGANYGTYSLVATEETGTNTSNYKTLAMGTSAMDTIDDFTDTDYYRVTLDNTKSYVFKMTVTGGVGTLSDSFMNVRNLSNATQTATASYATTADYSFRWEPGTTGDYYLEAAGTGANAGTYRISAEVEAGSNIAKSLSIGMGSILNVAIDDATDIDYYKITVDNTKSYSFRMVSSGGVGTLTDSLLQVRNGSDAAQTATASNATGSDYIFRWDPTTSGDYYLDARGVGAIAGTYRLQAEVEAGGTRAKALPVAIGSTTNASIDDTGDIDYYKVSLENGKSYLFKMVSSGGAGTLTDSVLTLENSTGGAVTASGTIGTNPDYSLRWQATSTADFYLSAQGVTGTTGTYRFIAELEPGSTNATALAVTVGTPVTAALEGGNDIDMWAVELTADYTYEIKMAAGTLTDTYINGIRDISNTLQANTQVDNGTGAATIAAFTPTVSGTYFIQADNGVNSSTATGTYTLTVTQTNPVPQGMQAQAYQEVALVGVSTFEADSSGLLL